MNRPVPSYHDSGYFIHQRYEDTSLLIFQKQQKLKQDAKKQAKSFPALYREPAPGTSDQSDFSRYGNRGVVAKEIATGNRLDDRPSVQSTVCTIT